MTEIPGKKAMILVCYDRGHKPFQIAFYCYSIFREKNRLLFAKPTEPCSVKRGLDAFEKRYRRISSRAVCPE